MNIYFVILHYQNSDITLKCVEYIKNISYHKKCYIVIVDNASPNNSGEILKRKYLEDKQVKVILNKENLGFSKGNNSGYKYAKEKGADIIIVQNSDVLIKQNEFIEILIKSDILDDYYIIGPDIINKRMQHQNPLRLFGLSRKRINELYVYNLLISIIYRNIYFSKMFLKYKKCIISKIKSKEKRLCLENQQDVVLHGSCVIYTKNWIKNEDFAFLPLTFMFFEEDILYEYVKKKKYNTMFFPTLQVVHEEDSSIDFNSINEIAKRNFVCKNMLNSLRVLKNIHKIIKNM